MNDVPAGYCDQLEEHQPVQKNHHMIHKPPDGNSQGEIEQFLVTLCVKLVIEQITVSKLQWFIPIRK